MSSYWGATAGYGLVLSWEEYCQFLKAYIETRPYTDWVIDYCECEDLIGEDNDMSAAVAQIDFHDLLDYLEDANDFEYIWSNEADHCASADHGRKFMFECVDSRECDGLVLHPFAGEVEYPTGIATMVAWGDLSDSVFAKEHYNSIFDLVDEMRHKMQRYLPKDFNWMHHIGHFAFARNC